jgi:predicted nucleotidyltransferase
LAEDNQRGGAEREIDSGVLPKARLRESQLYWWKGKLRAGRDERTMRRPGVNGHQTSFALVSEEVGTTDAASSSC